VLLFFALGLMCKPMLVTLPLVLVLLDYWPLNRFAPLTLAPVVTGNDDSLKNHSFPWRLIFEKIPLLALSGAACVATMVAQKDIIVPMPLALRIGNAAVSYVVYLRQMLCPAGLAVLYPYPQNGLPGWEITLAVVLLAGISAGIFLRRQRQPYLLMGWLWYLGMLVPAIGLVQSGLRAYADRYTYLPQIGLYLMLTWGAADLCAGWRHRRVVLGGGSAIILTALIICARAQTAYWRNSESLWTHTLACTSANYIAHNNLGYALLQKGSVDEAMVHFQKSLQIKPDDAEACYNLGYALLQKGRVNEAIAHFHKALQINPDYSEAHNNLGNVLLQMGSVAEAITHYQKALQIKPDNAVIRNNLGNALFQKGRVDEAITQYQAALQIRPDYAAAHNNLGMALFQKGKVAEAITHYQAALQIRPDYAAAHNNLGMALFQKGKVDEAITHYQTALLINPDYAEAHNNLGNALLNKGSVDEAITHYQKTLHIKPDYVEAHNNLGNALLKQGRVDEAITHYQKALQIKPDSAVIRNNLGNALVQKGKVDEAITHYQAALQINPDYAEAHNNLGNALLQKGRVGEAIVHFQKTLQIKPDSVDLLNNLAWLLATGPDAHLRDGVQAVKYAGRACELTHYGVTLFVGTLAAAYAEAGRYDDAIAAAQNACALAEKSGEQDLLKRNQKLLVLYRAHQPYHEDAGKVVPAAP
jgi:tetratricopeptide (TPR) repeat protein